MLSTRRYDEATAALSDAEETVGLLHEGCCQPLRSPRMEHLAATLRMAREQLDAIHGGAGTAPELIDILREAGAQLGHLQVACCAPDRLELYTVTFESLSTVQRTVTRAFSLAH